MIKKCLVCKIYLSKPADQITAPLPKDRVTESSPFSVCGFDYAGPINVKYMEKSRKSYILLITYAVTRSLHLELVSDTTIDSFLLAFRRFLSRRLNCEVIYSDNVKTFKKAKKDITKLIRHSFKHSSVKISCKGKNSLEKYYRKSCMVGRIL